MGDARQVVASAFEGCYEAERAAALSGVPISTVYHWARVNVVRPSVSPSPPKRCSYADLMALRTVSWLRRPKGSDADRFGASPMAEVRRALDRLAQLGLDIWSNDEAAGTSPLLVDRAGRILNAQDEVHPMEAAGQGRLDRLDLLGPFHSDLGGGPDLIRPRPHLRIVPGKVAGEPHIARSRLTTLTVAALAAEGYDAGQIADLYPDEDKLALQEAAELEQALTAHARAA